MFRTAVLFAAMSAVPLAAMDYARIADRIVSALQLQPGERVLVRYDPNCFAPILQPLTVRLRHNKATVRAITHAEGVTPALLETADVYVLLPLSERARALAPDESSALKAWVDRGGTRRELHFPWSDGSRRADGLQGQHTPELDRMYERALSIDHQELSRNQDEAIKTLRLGTVRVSTPAGTDLMFRVGKRNFNKQDGNASPSRARNAKIRIDRHIELPAGGLRVSPVEESISGQIVIPEARFGDAIARKVMLQVDNGRITRVRAEEGLEVVNAALAAGGDAAKRVREFGLGFNPALVTPADGIIPYYGYGAGVVRISLGDNEEPGGNVRGDFVRWFYFPDATVHVDFRYLAKGGKLAP